MIMDNQKIEKIKEVIKDFKNHSNDDLKFAMDSLSEEFERTKKNVIDLTYHLDNVQNAYNSILKEYKKRTRT